MRISQSSFFSQISRQLTDQQSRVFQTQAQISSGQRLQQPADQPELAARLHQLASDSAVNKRYQANLQKVQDTYNLQESALSNAVQQVQRINELSLQAANGSYNAADRRAIGVEVEQLLAGLLDIANQKGMDDSYLFSGYGQQLPFVDNGNNIIYQGSNDQLQVLVGENHHLQVGMPGSLVFGQVLHRDDSSGTITTIDLFTTLKATQSALASDDVDAVRASLDQLSSVHEHLVVQQSATGSRMQRADTLQDILADRDQTLQSLRSQLADVDYIEAVTQLKNQSLALQAGQQSFAQISSLSLFNYIR